MIGFINLLSAATIDNTANISAAAPRLIGQTTIAGAPVDEFRYGRSGNTTLWIPPSRGARRRSVGRAQQPRAKQRMRDPSRDISRVRSGRTIRDG